MQLSATIYDNGVKLNRKQIMAKLADNAAYFERYCLAQDAKHAETMAQLLARHRVSLKRSLRRLGYVIDSKITTNELEKLAYAAKVVRGYK